MPITYRLAEPLEAKASGGTPAEMQDTITVESDGWKKGYLYEADGETVKVVAIAARPATSYRPPTTHRPAGRAARAAGRDVRVIRGFNGTTVAPHEPGTWVDIGPA
jgi:hypothetical protein